MHEFRIVVKQIFFKILYHFILGCSLLVCLTLMTLLLELMVPTAHSGVPFIGNLFFNLDFYFLQGSLVTLCSCICFREIII